MADDLVGDSFTQPITLERMPQQAGLLGSEDDWTGLTSSAERRKLQNRINQRAYRKRKLHEAKPRRPIPPNTSGGGSNQEDSSSDGRTGSVTNFLATSGEHHLSGYELWQLFHSAARSPRGNRSQMARLGRICRLGSVETEQIVFAFEKWADSLFNAPSPMVDHLLVLLKFNIFRAMVSNSKALGYQVEESMDDDSLSHFTDPTNPNNNTVTLPSTLHPTKLQKEIPHHPWIDILPIPAMRDNLLRAGDTYDEMELCSDLVGYSDSSGGKTGMIIWGEPWDPSGWEVTESFLRCWGWTIRGCDQLFQATNYWRQRRGEKPLDFRRVLCEEIFD